VIEPRAKQLLVLIGQVDTWHERPLYEAIVATLEKEGLAGVSVLGGMMGYGAHRRVHRKGLFGVSDDKPVAIVAIDNEQKIRAGAEAIRHMVREGLIAISDIEVILQAGGEPTGL
jgi:PII-like signaling protein